ncbi:DNA-binding protein [Herminiimonas sp. KBW02]|uniref:YceD family protein n=1 Tax=Herminiimonas sp. KBW02 TaxID=2153363 RepID=UPI000F5B5FB6|nr:YceD family protein [Herminiimonas sp. KBW02]RQO33364.1 DNA-binding protein [Herminiimonas sp. KBW02]
MNAFVIDAFEFSRHREQREGDVAIADLPRLAAESVNMPASLHWSLHGGTDGLGHPQLIMSVSGSVHLMCQRCMTPLKFDIASESVLVLAKNDEHADEIDALLADDTIDVIVGSKTLNVSDLIEDEALLSLPQAPKHDVCPDNAAVESAMNARKPSPFDVLKGMKQ